MSKIIHISGAKGVGKTTILKEINLQVSPQGHEVQTAHMSELLYELSSNLFKRQWSQLSAQERLQLRLAAREHVTHLNKPVVLLDSHLIDMQGDTPKLIMPPEFEQIIDGYVVLTARTDQILAQRFGDTDFRKRDMDPVRIAAEDEAEKYYAEQLAARKGLRPLIVRNFWKPDTMRDILEGVDLFMAGGMKIEGGKGNEGITFRNNERL